MDVYGIKIPEKALSNFELVKYVKILKIPNFRGVFMKDNLPKIPKTVENGIVNFNTMDQPGSHWVAYFKQGTERIYFDSFGQVTLQEIQNYLKKEGEGAVIQRNTEIVQPFNSVICGHLCLFVLKSLTSGLSFRDTLNSLKVGGGIQWTTTMADELHKPIKKKFPKRFVFVRNVDDIWAADLIDLQKLSQKNSGFRYILMIIDVFSKYGWAIPLKTKKGEEMAKALQSIFKDNTPKKLWVDKGKEFYNKDVDKLRKKYNIEMYSTKTLVEFKCSVVERWNRTIKTQLWRYFSANGTHKYLNILQPLIDKYNSTKHRAIGMTPSDARKPSNHQQVFKKLYFDKVQKRLKVPKFQVGDSVRITVKKNIFKKGYSQNWTDKIYKIDEVLKTLPTTYRIKSESGVLKKTFYEQELQLSKTTEYNIEKILKYKTVKGKRFARVKWQGYDSSYNSWEPIEAIRKL